MTRAGNDADTLYRHWALLRLVPRAPRRIDTSRLEALLAEEGIVIGRRSIQRDLERLAARFTTLRCDDSHKPYAWYWEADAPLVEIPGMGTPAAVTFTLIEAHLGATLPRSTLKSLEPHFERARQTLAQAETARIARWPKKVRVVSRGPPLRPPDVPARVLDVVYDALISERRFKARYLKRGATSARELVVNPLGLIVREGTLTLVSTLFDYDDVLHLLLHRMRHVEPLDTPGRRPRGFDLDEHIRAGGFGFAVGAPIVLEALIETEVAITLGETPLARDQRVDAAGDGRSRLTATVADTLELRGWLLSYGPLIEVVGPEKLRSELRESVRAMAKRYRVRE
ncbi:MAG: WYL domain-containing protein [Sorangiineae bacterium]|nr:WYL domain-containing protein [Polyangiaceae bacterium]MEB2323007.1 WYL domain-containing protein [Sorangiineae bacterium]